MKTPKLRWLLEGETQFECALSPTRKPLSATEVMRINLSVLSDARYTLEVSPVQLREQVELFINGNEIFSFLRVKGECVEIIPGKNAITGQDDTRPFQNLFGFVQVEVRMNGRSFYSDYFQVLLPDTELSSDLKSMVQYIAKHRESLLVKSSPVSNAPTGDDSLQDLTEMFELIVGTYESHIGYFTNHAHTKLIQVQSKDSFEKIRSFSGQTLMSILQNAAELLRVNYPTGLSDGHNHYQPRHALVSESLPTKETIENRVIVGFLLTAITKIDELVEQAQVALKQNSCASAPPGYVSPIDAIWPIVNKRIQSTYDKLCVIRSKIGELLSLYQRLLPVTTEPLAQVPEPTQAFLRLPVYRLFYELMDKWFSLPEYRISNETQVLAFLVNSQLYEYFVLASEIKGIEDSGFVLQTSFNFNWLETEANIGVEDTKFANTFVFRKGDSVATLYFQPVIAGDVSTHNNGIGLQRITTLTLNHGMAGAHFYRPDFIIKVQNGNSAHYTIMDAKYSTLETVQRYYAADLAFKYLTSVRCTRVGDQIRGLHIYYGKRGSEDVRITNFWNLLTNEHMAIPHFSAEGRFPLV